MYSERMGWLAFAGDASMWPHHCQQSWWALGVLGSSQGIELLTKREREREVLIYRHAGPHIAAAAAESIALSPAVYEARVQHIQSLYVVLGQCWLSWPVFSFLRASSACLKILVIPRVSQFLLFLPNDSSSDAHSARSLIGFVGMSCPFSALLNSFALCDL